MKKQISLLTVLLAVGMLFYGQSAFGQCTSSDPSSPVGIIPDFVAGNPALCTGGSRLNNPESGTTIHPLDAFGNTVTVIVSSGPCGEVFSWSVDDNIIIDHVVAKGGPNANDYDYTEEDPRPTSDGDLHAPLVSSTEYADLSHIDFCFHYKLDIDKTATAEFTRTYEWDIDKSCDPDDEVDDPLILSSGQPFNYPFSWTVDATHTDSDIKVTGTITIANNTPYTATITSVTDTLAGGNVSATVDCGDDDFEFPYNLASGATLECTYSADLDSATDGTNTVTVVTNTPLVEGGTATADYDFDEPTTAVDECIEVTDNCNETVQVCASQAPYTNDYTCEVGPYDACGDFTYTNTASFVTNDTEASGSDSCDVNIHVPCEGGCTLTPGYWKTHSEKGPAPYDNTWAQLPNGADTPFFLSGQTYYQVLWTSPNGNAYYILAHAYIAAQLNSLNGADLSAVQTQFNTATTLFNTYTPAQIGALKGSDALRKQFISLAETLDKYNNGLIGPGHCSEETTSD